VLTTRPAGTVPGYAYFINAGTGEMTKLFDAIPGMTALFSTSGTMAVVGRTVANSYSLELATLSSTTAPSF